VLPVIARRFNAIFEDGAANTSEQFIRSLQFHFCCLTSSSRHLGAVRPVWLYPLKHPIA
jgi:hypothetical protein